MTWLRSTSVLLFLFICSSSLTAQTGRSNLGRSFYLSFAPNGTNVDYLALYLTSRTKTQCKIEITSLGYAKTVFINPGTVTSVFLPYIQPFSAEVRDVEQTSKGMAIRIQSDSDIVVYGHTHTNQSTDAFLGLPISSIGKEYFALCYQSFVAKFQRGSFKIPGQFIIVANEDSTVIEISPSCKTLLGKPANQIFQILLNAGDVYLVQSDTASSSNDLTGSHIISNKPISVLSGHNDTSIPDTSIRSNGDHTTTDVLVEMLPPVTSWGNSALVIPFATTQAPDLVRVVSAEDGNTININGIDVATLNAGQFYELQGVSQPLVIHSTNPMLVGQYMHSTVDSIPYGDPALTLVYPVEQYDTAYTIMSVQDPAYVANFINITTETSNINTVELDGSVIAAGSFKPIIGSSYSFAQLNVKQGVHNLRATKGFGVTVYALGGYDSYAYPGGTLLKPLVPAEAVLSVFDTVLVCKGKDKFITITNPNSVAARVKSLTVDETIPNSFVVNVSLPLVIDPGASVQIPIHFSPQDTGVVNGTVTIEFQSPRHQTISLTIKAYARKLPLGYSIPSATHLLGGEQTILPIYVTTDLTQAQALGYTITLHYDPTLVQDINYSQDGTLSTNGYIDITGTAGDRQLIYTDVNPIRGGGIGSKPLLNIIFKSQVSSAFENPVEQNIPINYDVILQQAALDDGCFFKQLDSGVIVIDSSCSNPRLSQDSTAPLASYISIARPNPFMSTTTLEYGIASSGAQYKSQQVRIRLYNELGNLVRTIIDEIRPAGYYTLTIDGTGLSNGIYNLVLESSEEREYARILFRR